LLVAARLPVSGSAAGLLEVESVEASGEARGALETWPFTSTVIDLLGPRWIARGRLAARWERAQASVDISMNRRLRLRGGVGWYDARLAASLYSWRPTFLLFGRSDERFAVLPVNRLQLASVVVGSEARVGDVRVTLGVQQFVPVRVFERENGPAGNTGSGASTRGSPAGRPARHISWPGGTSIELRLLRHL
jgi:hypothetical protein